MAFCEISQDQSPGTPAAAGDFGFKVLTASDPAEKTKKLSAELANGRLAPAPKIHKIHFVAHMPEVKEQSGEVRQCAQPFDDKTQSPCDFTLVSWILCFTLALCLSTVRLCTRFTTAIFAPVAKLCVRSRRRTRCTPKRCRKVGKRRFRLPRSKQSKRPMSFRKLIKLGFCYSYVALMCFAFLFLPVHYAWSPSNVTRNRVKHALEGNGGSPKGKGPSGKGKQGKGKAFSGKGKASAETQGDVFVLQNHDVETFVDTQQAEIAQHERASNERAFAQEVMANLPAHLSSLHQTQLLQQKWNSTVCLPHELGPRGGVSLIKKHELVQVLKQVGQTTRATAVVTTQPAHELHMRGAPCTEIWCTIRVPTDTGTTTAYVKRYLIQLGMDPSNAVHMETHGLIVVQQSIAMQKVVISFDQKGGWDTATMSAIIVSDLLKSMISETAFDQITIRSDGSATALIHKSCVGQLLRSSGKSHVYIKPHVGEVSWQDIEILWLPATVTHEEALQLCQENADSLGLARKQGGEGSRFGLRFGDLEKMKGCAEKLKLGHIVDLGRFKITAIMTGTGSSDLFQMMASIKWTLESVEYIGEGHAIVSAKQCPATNKLCLKRLDGAQVQMWIHAVNAKARAMFKNQNIQSRQVDAEGEEADKDVPMTGVSLEDKFKAAAADNTRRSEEQKGSTRRESSRTPKRPPPSDRQPSVPKAQGHNQPDQSSQHS